MWLWALVWPDTAGAVLLERFDLVDLRRHAPAGDVEFGALSPRLAA